MLAGFNVMQSGAEPTKEGPTVFTKRNRAHPILWGLFEFLRLLLFGLLQSGLFLSGFFLLLEEDGVGGEFCRRGEADSPPFSLVKRFLKGGVPFRVATKRGKPQAEVSFGQAPSALTLIK
jgi:hypothetical protein